MKNRTKEIKEMERLHLRAMALLNAAQDMQYRIDAKLKYNAEVAEPNGFTPFDDNEIDTCVRGRDRLMYSHLKVISAILEV
jgi:hypothetical protein